MALRPELEARVSAIEAAAAVASERTDEASDKVEKLIKRIDDSLDGSEPNDGIPEEAFDDPSVVRHTTDLAIAARRTRRESKQLRVVGSQYSMTTKRR